MNPQCEIIGKYALPIFRSMLAKELVQKYKLSQSEAAKKLGTTQAAVSQYLSAKRAYRGTMHIAEYLPKIQAVANQTAKQLMNQEIATEDITPNFCSLCASFCRYKEIPESEKPEYYI